MTIPCRGTIVKTPDATPGLLVINGRQKPFVIEGMWKSPVAPAVNMTVDAEFDGGGAITSVAVVDGQQASAERVNPLGDLAHERGKEAAALVRQGLRSLMTQMGKATLGALAILWIAWFFLPAMTIGLQGLANTTRSFTFWDLLGINTGANLSEGRFNHGGFAALGLLALVVPFASPFIRNWKGKFLFAAPLAYVVIAYFVIESDFNNIFAGAFGVTLAYAQTILGFSLSYGAFVLGAACVFLAVQALRHPGYGAVAATMPVAATTVTAVTPAYVAAPASGSTGMIAVTAETAFCTKCGKPMSGGEEFCTGCGARRE